MKKKNRVLILTISIILMMGFVIRSFAQEVKKYPPYPDVWGYEIINADKSVIDPHIVIIKMSDNDYMIRYITKVKKIGKDLKFSRAGHLFFSGKTIEFGQDVKEVQRISDEARKEERYHSFIVADSLKPKIVFRDGGSLERKGTWSGGCDNPFSADKYYVKKTKDGNIIKEKVLVLLLSKPIKEEIDSKCERNWDYKEKYYYRRVAIMPSSYMISLEDDTFMLVFRFIREINGKRSVPIIRFDKDFNTKADLIKYNFFLLDRLEYINVIEKSKGDDNSNHEVVADYLLKLKKGGSKDGDSK